MKQPRCQLLNETKANLLVIENRFRKLSWEHEVLEQRYAQSKSERDEMRDEYEKTIYNVKQKSGFDNQLIRKKISAVNNSLEQHDAQLLEVFKKLPLKYCISSYIPLLGISCTHTMYLLPRTHKHSHRKIDRHTNRQTYEHTRKVYRNHKSRARNRHSSTRTHFSSSSPGGVHGWSGRPRIHRFPG